MRRSWLRTIAPFWILLVVAGSFMPFGMKQELGTPLSFSRALLYGDVPPWHRFVHFVSFGSTTAILVLIARSSRQRVMALLAVLALALSIEFVQNLIDRYGIEWWDVRDDSLAAGVAYLLLLIPILRRVLVRDQ